MTETQRHQARFGFIKDRIGCGWYHFAGLLENGTVKAFGKNNVHQCEVSDWTDVIKIKCGPFHTVGLKKDGTAVATKGDVFKDGTVPGEGIESFSGVVDIACGSFHNVGLRSDGTVVACGSNKEGQCNVEDWTDVKSIYAALYHTIAVCNDGSLLYCGKNDGGSLNFGDISGVKKLYCGLNDTVIITEDDKVYITDFDQEQPVLIDIVGNEIAQVEFDVDYFLILKADGTVMHFGSDEHGLNGVKEWKDIRYILCARTVASGSSDEIIYMTGSNGVRTIDMGGIAAVFRSEYVMVFVKKRGWIIAMDEKGEFLCEQFRLFYVDNVGNEKPETEEHEDITKSVLTKNIASIPDNEKNRPNDAHKCGIAWDHYQKYGYLRQRISGGLGHSAAIMYDGSVKACGANGYDQCEVDDWRNIKSVICTVGATLGLSDDGTVCFTGEIPVSDNCTVQGTHPLKWPNNVKSIVRAANTDEHVVGLLDDGRVVAYGCNDDGQCNVTEWQDIVEVSAQRALTAGVRKDGTVVICGKSSAIRNIVSRWTNIEHIFKGVGDQSLVGLKKDGTVVTTDSDLALDLSLWKDVIDISVDDYIAGITGDGHVYFAGKKVPEDLLADGMDDIVFVNADTKTVIKSNGVLQRFGFKDGKIEAEDIQSSFLFTQREFVEDIYVFADGSVYINILLSEAEMGQDECGDWKLIKLQTNTSSHSEETSTAQQSSSGGCYVATCVYGSYDCPQVWTLRRYRDNTLGSTWYGRSFIRTYYAISPTLVKWFGNTSWFKKLWKGKLDRMVAKLNADGVEDTPYQDRNW